MSELQCPVVEDSRSRVLLKVAFRWDILHLLGFKSMHQFISLAICFGIRAFVGGKI